MTNQPDLLAVSDPRGSATRRALGLHFGVLNFKEANISKFAFLEFAFRSTNSLPLSLDLHQSASPNSSVSLRFMNENDHLQGRALSGVEVVQES